MNVVPVVGELVSSGITAIGLSEVGLKFEKVRLPLFDMAVTSPRLCLSPRAVTVCNLFDVETCVRNLDAVPVKVVVYGAEKAVPLREGCISAADATEIGTAGDRRIQPLEKT